MTEGVTKAREFIRREFKKSYSLYDEKDVSFLVSIAKDDITFWDCVIAFVLEGDKFYDYSGYWRPVVRVKAIGKVWDGKPKARIPFATSLPFDMIKRLSKKLRVKRYRNIDLKLKYIYSN